MGSVGPSYKCPLCGRTGNGGYALDGIDFPICIGFEDSDWSCLWDDVLKPSWTDITHRHVLALRGVVLLPHQQRHPTTLSRVLMANDLARQIIQFVYINK